MSGKDAKNTPVAAAAASAISKAAGKHGPQEPVHAAGKDAPAQEDPTSAAPKAKVKEQARSQGMDEVYIHTAAGPVSMRLTEEEISAFRAEVLRNATAAATKEMLGVEEAKHLLHLERNAATEAQKDAEIASKNADASAKRAYEERRKLDAAVKESQVTAKKTAIQAAMNIATGIIAGAVAGAFFAFGTKVAGGASVKLKQ